jgi:hypothetical protein
MQSAGIIFTFYGTVLIGQKRNGYWSGIGGKLEKGETPKTAAVRESLEEIFGIFDEEVAAAIAPTLRLTFVYDIYGFTLYRATFSTLEKIASSLVEMNVSSIHYPDGIPTTIDGLVSEFRPKGEIAALALINKSNFFDFQLDKYFKGDLKKIGMSWL